MIRLRIYVDLDNIKYNVNYIRNFTKKDIIAVVKSNAYGLGAKKIVKTLLKQNVQYFFFNKFNEYLVIKDLLFDKNVIIFESLSYDKILKYYTENIILTINSYNDFLIYQSTKMKIRTHLQVDTGMNRIGFSCLDDVKKIIELCPPNILIEGIYTHYASSCDEYDYFEKQQERFKKYLSLYDFKIIHSNASSSLHKNIIGNMVRVGIGLYGYHTKLQLKKSVFGTTKIINAFWSYPNMLIGYHGKYISKTREYIGVVDIGYYDSNLVNKVYIDNKKYMFVGKTCMNHAYITIDDKIQR